MLATYSYDGLGRRVTENTGTLTDVYFSSQWQAVEDDVSGAMKDQYVWSPVYVNAMIERDTPTQRLYVQQNADWNVTALVSTAGAAVERYLYDPYGAVTYLAGGWGSRSSRSYNWQYLFQGGRFSTATGLYNFQQRDYSPSLGRWLEDDPSGFAGGDENLYRAELDAPVTETDPTGLWSWEDIPVINIVTTTYQTVRLVSTWTESRQLDAKLIEAQDRTSARQDVAEQAMRANTRGSGGISSYSSSRNAAWERSYHSRTHLGVELAKPLANGAVQFNAMGPAFLSPSIVARRGYMPRWADSPGTGGLKGHAGKHGGIGNIPSDPAAYYNSAVGNIRTGTPYRFYHDGQFKWGFVTPAGNGQYVFTSTSLNGQTIFTHMQVSEQYLRNIGITLKQR